MPNLILVLDQGRIVQRGTHQELCAQDGIYRRISDVQARIEVEVRGRLRRHSQRAMARPGKDPGRPVRDGCCLFRRCRAARRNRSLGVARRGEAQLKGL